MSKKIYFMVTSIITFILSIYSAIMANETVKVTLDELKKLYGNFPEKFQDRVLGIYEKAGAKMIIVFACIVIIASILIFIFALNNTILKHKGIVIALTVMTFFFTDVLLVQLIGIASFIVILCCKRKNPEDFQKKKKKIIPNIELEKPTTKDIVYGILLLLVYFSQFAWSKYIPDDYLTSISITIIFNVMMIVLCILVFYKQFIRDFKYFKSNASAYFRFIIPRIGISYIFLFVASLISVLLTKNATTINQEAVESLSIYYLIPVAVIYAPIVEETLFRGVLRKFIKNGILFIIVSAIIFGVLHTITEASLFNILIMALPYSVLGAYLAYSYKKTNNIIVPIIGHAIFNLISTIFMILSF